MENQNRFDLDQAIRAWREHCACLPGISFDNARELESDLRERVADFLKQGLNEAEAFGKAVHQVGAPAELAREFARENPLTVWRDRLFWIVAAGFAVSVWSLLTDGVISWLVNTFGVLLLLPAPPAWFSLARNLPLLAMAALMATGRLENVAARVRFFGRPHLAVAGSCLLAAGLSIRLFGPYPLTAPESFPVKVIGLSLWPLLLLSLASSLFRPVSTPQAATSAPDLLRLPVAVWRLRVFWMAVGGLAVGVWQTVSWLGMMALFYTGDVNRPFMDGPQAVFVGSYLLMELSPLIVLGLLLLQRMRAGKDVTARKLVRSRALFAFIPLAVCAWAALHMWSEYFWRPAGPNTASWVAIVANYFATFRWLWPAGLALLILWLAPRGENQTSESVAAAIDSHPLFSWRCDSACGG